MWLILALSCSLFNALQGTYGKKILDQVDPYALTWATFAYSLPVMGLAVAVDGIPPLRPDFWPALAVTLLINLLAVTLYIKAIKASPMSLTFPFLAFTPLFLVLTAFLALGERPGALGSAGILLIVAGAYALNLDRISGGLLAPLGSIVRERGSLLMLGAALLWGISAAADKVALLNSSPVFFVFAFHVAFSLLYLPVLRWKLGRQAGQAMFHRPAAQMFFALLGVVAILSQMMAVRLTLVSYVIGIKRAGMIFNVLLGYVLFGERKLGQRLGAAALMIVGVSLLLW